MMHTITPSTFFSQPSAQGQQQPIAPGISQAPASAPTLTSEEREERKRQFKASIQALLQPSSFSGAQAVYQLTERIADYGTAEVDAQTRAEILARIRDGAGNHYYRAWSENPTAIDITREWIKSAAKSDNPLLVDTVMPLLHVRHCQSCLDLIDGKRLTSKSFLAHRSIAAYGDISNQFQARKDH